MLDFGELFFELYVREENNNFLVLKIDIFFFLQMVKSNTLSRWARVSVKRENLGLPLLCGNLLRIRRVPQGGSSGKGWRRVGSLFKLSG